MITARRAPMTALAVLAVAVMVQGCLLWATHPGQSGRFRKVVSA